MWLFCGSEHVTSDDRFVYGYSKSNMPKNFFLDIDKYCWRKKNNAIGNISNISIIAPSQWMFERAKQSKILKKSNISVINIPLDVDFWRFRPKEKVSLLPKHLNITFGTSSFSKDKGLLMFVNSLILLRKSTCIDHVVVNYVGNLDNEILKRTPFSYNNHGFISSNIRLREVYQKSDLCIFPSYIESFGQMAAESAIAGAYVIAYSKTGVSDFIKNGENGTLFSVYTEEALSEAINQSIASIKRLNILKYNKLTINKELSLEYIGNKYGKLLDDIVQHL